MYYRGKICQIIIKKKTKQKKILRLFCNSSRRLSAYYIGISDIATLLLLLIAVSISIDIASVVAEVEVAAVS